MKADNTSLTEYQKCPRAFHYSYQKGYVPFLPSPSLIAGEAVHQTLETFYEKGAVEALKFFNSYYHNPCGCATRTVEKIASLLTGYFLIHKSEPFKIIKQEVRFSLPLTSTLTYTGRIDLLGEDEFGFFGCDHKTSVYAPKAKDYLLSPQFLGYLWALDQVTGKQIKRFMLNGFQITKTKKPEDSFFRFILNYSSWKKENWKAQVITLMQEIKNKGGFFPNYFSCIGKYGACQFYEACCLPNPEDFILNSGLFEKRGEWLASELGMDKENKINDPTKL